MVQNTRLYEYSVQIFAFQCCQIQKVDLKTIFHCSSSTIHQAAETAVCDDCWYLHAVQMVFIGVLQMVYVNTYNFC